MLGGAGIIPARAGFTGVGDDFGGHGLDHPRSRGVYPPRGPRIGASSGSSPLARGLLRPLPGSGEAGGIIPARAGFTPGRRSAPAYPSDHPRSRGVYLKFNLRPVDGAGSSPLARGLLVIPRVSCSIDGIIPARAGFTHRRRPRPRPGRDHPRSRGVYFSPDLALSGLTGSSPLARGLLGEVGSSRDLGRIIPARAGFTSAKTGHSPRTWDHPRSRGVYTCGS